MTDLPSFPFEEGPREYQISALNAWKSNGYKGFFAMATGTGKTVTALNCLLDSYQSAGRYRALIFVPTISLVDQWTHECKRFHFNNITKISSKEPHWKDDITRITSSSYLDSKSSFIVIVTYASLARKEISAWLEDLPTDAMVIADEAHNLGTKTLMQAINRLPFSIRIGLSATPHRQFDYIGNESIVRYFSIEQGYTFSYTMGEAIANGVLCHYDYYPHIIQLNEREMADYCSLSRKIVKFFDPITETFEDSPILTALLIKRKRIIHKAAAKLPAFEQIVRSLYKEKGSLRFTMVYAPEGECPDDILDNFVISDADFMEDDSVPIINLYTSIVSDIDTHITVEQFTSKDKDRERILDDFAMGKTHVLVAMKCLDEGVDIPRAENAIFCSSTGNPRQFIQRRGRILRVHKDKRKACIHDLVVAPYVDNDSETYSMERALISNELRRVSDFASLADNSDFSESVLKDITDYYSIAFNQHEQVR